MKKNFLFIALLLGLFLVPKAYALECEVSQALGGNEACYTRVQLSSAETTLVSTGVALVYEVDNSRPNQAGYQVRIARASTENNIVAGFAQGNIASGNSAMILVRGFGLVKTVGGIVSGDNLTVTASGNVGAIAHNIGVGNIDQANLSSLTTVAVALEASTTNGTTARRALVKVI